MLCASHRVCALCAMCLSLSTKRLFNKCALYASFEVCLSLTVCEQNKYLTVCFLCLSRTTFSALCAELTECISNNLYTMRISSRLLLCVPLTVCALYASREIWPLCTSYSLCSMCVFSRLCIICISHSLLQSVSYVCF